MENKSEPYISVIYQLRVPARAIKLLQDPQCWEDFALTVRKANWLSAKTAYRRGGPSVMDTPEEEPLGEGNGPQSGG